MPNQQNYYWNGSTWVDGSGFDTAQAQPQNPLGQGRQDLWGQGTSGQEQAWGRARDLTGDIFGLYRSQLGGIQQLENDRRGLYSQYMSTLNNPQGEYQRTYQTVAGQGAGQAEAASNQAAAYGGDPRAAGLNALNANAVQANQSAAQVYDPRLRDQRMAAAMQMQEMLSSPLIGNILQQLMQYDLAREGHAISDPRNSPQSGLGSILGSLLGAAGGAGGFGSLFS